MATALLLIDVQNDFCPGGALPAQDGDQVVPVLNRAITHATNNDMPVYASRDWHPEQSKHFQEHGGPWPPHCVQGTPGAEFHPSLELPQSVDIVTKGDDPNEDEGYSAFEGTTDTGRNLSESLRAAGIDHLIVGGLATDFCVVASVLDARENGFAVSLLTDGVRPVELEPGNGDRAISEMQKAGTALIDSNELPR